MLIVLSGKARCGKNTLGDMLQEVMTEEYFIMGYADDLKRRVGKDFDLSREQLYGDLKEVPDERYTKSNGVFWTPREILQHMGTEAYRAINDSFWVTQLFNYIHRNSLKNVIIIDGRFPDEIKAVTSRQGYHIKINRDHDIKVHNAQHASETSLDKFTDVDFIVDNNGTLDELKQKALEIKREIENGR